MANNKKVSFVKLFCVAILSLVLGFAFGFAGYTYINLPKDSDVYVSGDLSIHFLEMGNRDTGDCIYIKAGDTDILVDSGSLASSSSTISSYINNYVTDNTLEYVIATHSHKDHIAGFVGSSDYDSLFELYECEVIIDFPMVHSKTTIYNKYVEQRENEKENGAKHYNALQCCRQEDGAKKIYEISKGIQLEILYQKYYETSISNENEHSVCFMINQGDKHFLFTGDLEDKGEASLVEENTLPEMELYKAGHHGSSTSSSEALLEVIKPKYICITCNAGSTQYTDTKESTFPTQQTINRISEYTDKVYITTQSIDYDNSEYCSMNGNIIVISNNNGTKVQCSNNNTLLKDTEWFSLNREKPTKWVS